MPDLEIIDFHTHMFATADRGIAWQRGVNRNPNPPLNGTPEEFAGIMDKHGISHAVMLMYTPTRFMYEARLRGQQLPEDPAEREKIEREIKATMVQRMIENNEWAFEVQKKDPRFFNFAGVDPVFQTEQEMMAELDDKIRRGSKGGKIVLNALAIQGDDPRLWPFYDRLNQLELPFVTQAYMDFKGSTEKILDAFPRVIMDVAHLAHGHNDEIIDFSHRYPNFHADLSSRLHEIDDPEAPLTLESLADLIRKCGAEHILFGTNYPLNDPVLYARVMRELPLSDREKELIANGNAKRLLKI